MNSELERSEKEFDIQTNKQYSCFIGSLDPTVVYYELLLLLLLLLRTHMRKEKKERKKKKENDTD